jgi:hypothetical protein
MKITELYNDISFGDKFTEQYTWSSSKTPPNFDNCAIATISALTGKTEQDVWMRARKYWKPNLGMRGGQFVNVLNEFGLQLGMYRLDLTMIPDSESHVTLGRLYGLLKKEPLQKRFWITTRDHAIAYIHGKPIDVANRNPGEQVLSVYEVIPL